MRRSTISVSSQDIFQALEEKNVSKAKSLAWKLISAKPDSPDAYVALSQALWQNREYSASLQHAKRAMALAPFHSGAQLAVARTLVTLGEYREARVLLDEVLARNPGSTVPTWNRSFCNLALFDFAQGWLDYEAGYVEGCRRNRGIPSKRWRGQKVNTLLIHYEQGLGDQILFSRFIPMAKQLSGGTVLLETDPCLVGLFENMADRVWARTPDGSVPCDYDAHISIASLPFAMEIDDIDGSLYLLAPPTQISLKGARVGFCWKGNPRYPGDIDRSLTVEEARSFAGLAPFGFIQQAGVLPFKAPRLVGPDMAATASILTSLELIVTVDTSIANLAGALGKECWLIAPRYGEWRWGTEGYTTPWYDSVTVFRCHGGDRQRQIDEIRSAISRRYPA